MKLFHTPTSPFVRKVMVVAHELGVTLETTYQSLDALELECDSFSETVDLAQVCAGVTIPHA